mgnify:CR=1 FL=1
MDLEDYQEAVMETDVVDQREEATDHLVAEDMGGLTEIKWDHLVQWAVL